MQAEREHREPVGATNAAPGEQRLLKGSEAGVNG